MIVLHKVSLHPLQLPYRSSSYRSVCAIDEKRHLSHTEVIIEKGKVFPASSFLSKLIASKVINVAELEVDEDPLPMQDLSLLSIPTGFGHLPNFQGTAMLKRTLCPTFFIAKIP